MGESRRSGAGGVWSEWSDSHLVGDILGWLPGGEKHLA